MRDGGERREEREEREEGKGRRGTENHSFGPDSPIYPCRVARVRGHIRLFSFAGVRSGPSQHSPSCTTHTSSLLAGEKGGAKGNTIMHAGTGQQLVTRY